MRCLVEGSRLCHERLRLRGLGKKTEGCISASSWCCCVGGVVVLGKKKTEGKSWCYCVGEEEETKGRGFDRQVKN